MVLSKQKLEVILATILGCLVGLMRPHALGEVYSFHLSFLITAIILLIYITRNRSVHYNFRYKQPLIVQSSFVALFSVYMLWHSAVIGLVDASFVFKGVLLAILPVIAIFYSSQEKNRIRGFFDGFAFAIFISCFSITISFVLLSLGITYEALHVYDYSYTYEANGYVIFPWTLTFNLVDVGFGHIPRLSGFYREPGVVPAFACWGATYSYLRRWPMWTTICFITGSLCSLSSLGFIALLPAVLIAGDYFGMKLRNSLFIIIAFTLILWPVFYSLDGIGIQAKMDSGSGSFAERYDQFWAFFDIENVFFGDGSGWSIYHTNAINILSASRTYGFIYLILLILILSFSIFHSFLFFSGCIPFILICMTAQPIVMEPAAIAVWFSWLIFSWNYDESRI